MRRRLTFRETVLLTVLLVLAAGSAYYMFFFRPNREEKLAVELQILAAQDQIETDQLRLSRKQKMESELEDIFSGDPDPASMAPYDNGRAVLHELSSVLAGAEDYSLSFSTSPSAESDDVIRRTVSMSFSCAGYEQARDILAQLHDSQHRCLLENLSLSSRTGAETYPGGQAALSGQTTRVSDAASTEMDVSATLVYFEYTDGGAGSGAPGDSWSSDAWD